LPAGAKYVYRLRVQWDEAGKAVERTHDVEVQAGDRFSLTFVQERAADMSPGYSRRSNYGPTTSGRGGFLRWYFGRPDPNYGIHDPPPTPPTPVIPPPPPPLP